MKNIILLLAIVFSISSTSTSQVSDSIQWIKLDHNDGVLAKEFGKTHAGQFKIQVEFKFKNIGAGSLFMEEIESQINARFNYDYEVQQGEISTIYYTADWKTENTSIEMYTDIITVHFKHSSPIRMTYRGVFVGDQARRLIPDSAGNMQFVREEFSPYPSPILKTDSEGNPIEYGAYSPSGNKIGDWYFWNEQGYPTKTTNSIVLPLKVDQFGKPNSKDPNCLQCPLKSRIKEKWYEPERLGYVENNVFELVSFLPDSQYLEMKTPTGLAQGELFPKVQGLVRLSALPSDWVEIIGNVYPYKIENDPFSYAIECSTDPGEVLNRIKDKFHAKKGDWFSLDSTTRLILVDFHGLAPKKYLAMIEQIERIEGVGAISPYVYSSLFPESKVILSGIVYAEIRNLNQIQINETLKSCGFNELASNENYNYSTELKCKDKTVSGILKSIRCLSSSDNVKSVEIKIGGNEMLFHGLKSF